MNDIHIKELTRVCQFLKSASATLGDIMGDEADRAPFYPDSIERTVIRFDVDNLRFARNSVDDAVRNVEYILKRHEDLNR